jgi:hypothetical protein
MMGKLHFKTLVIAGVALAFGTFYGCNDSNDKGPDVSGINLTLNSRRFDKDLYAIDPNNIGAGLTQLKSKYPGFLDYFLDTLMAYNIYGNYSDTVAGIREGLKPFLEYKDFRELQDTVEKYYPDTRDLDEKLTRGFKILKYYFPSHTIPSILYLNMGLSKWPAFPIDSTTMCIGLDMFLGDQFPHYRAIGIPEYLKSHSRRSYIPVAVFSALYRGDHPLMVHEKSLLDLMLDKGREQYFLRKILPGTPDSVVFGFTQAQLDWCEANEALVFNFFIQNQLLYNKEAQNIMPYVTDGPFARGLEPVSNVQKNTPGNIGTWLGYKIVSAYMAQNAKTTLGELLNLNLESTSFLAKAKYKPR